MTSKTLLLIIFYLIASLPCESQSRIDLEALTFKENIDSLLAGIRIWREERAVLRTLPYVYTYDGSHFKFGPINFQDEVDEKYCVIKLLFSQADRKRVASLIILMGETSQSLSMYHHLKTKYGIPKTFLNIPTFDNSGLQLFYSSYLWSIGSNRSALLTHIYKYSQNKKVITSHLYVIDNRKKDVDGGLLIDRVISLCGG